jgi:hypothetical protein
LYFLNSIIFINYKLSQHIWFSLPSIPLEKRASMASLSQGGLGPLPCCPCVATRRGFPVGERSKKRGKPGICPAFFHKGKPGHREPSLSLVSILRRDEKNKSSERNFSTLVTKTREEKKKTTIYQYLLSRLLHSHLFSSQKNLEEREQINKEVTFSFDVAFSVAPQWLWSSPPLPASFGARSSLRDCFAPLSSLPSLRTGRESREYAALPSGVGASEARREEAAIAAPGGEGVAMPPSLLSKQTLFLKTSSGGKAGKFKINDKEGPAINEVKNSAPTPHSFLPLISHQGLRTPDPSMASLPPEGKRGPYFQRHGGASQRRVFPKSKRNEEFNSFFPYRKSFLCYWLLPFVGFVFTINKETNKNFLSISADSYLNSCSILSAPTSSFAAKRLEIPLLPSPPAEGRRSLLHTGLAMHESRRKEKPSLLASLPASRSLYEQGEISLPKGGASEARREGAKQEGSFSAGKVRQKELRFLQENVISYLLPTVKSNTNIQNNMHIQNNLKEYSNLYLQFLDNYVEYWTPSVTASQSIWSSPSLVPSLRDGLLNKRYLEGEQNPLWRAIPRRKKMIKSFWLDLDLVVSSFNNCVKDPSFLNTSVGPKEQSSKELFLKPSIFGLSKTNSLLTTCFARPSSSFLPFLKGENMGKKEKTREAAQKSKQIISFVDFKQKKIKSLQALFLEQEVGRCFSAPKGRRGGPLVDVQSKKRGQEAGSTNTKKNIIRINPVLSFLKTSFLLDNFTKKELLEVSIPHFFQLVFTTPLLPSGRVEARKEGTNFNLGRNSKELHNSFIVTLAKNSSLLKEWPRLFTSKTIGKEGLSSPFGERRTQPPRRESLSYTPKPLETKLLETKLSKEQLYKLLLNSLNKSFTSLLNWQEPICENNTLASLQELSDRGPVPLLKAIEGQKSESKKNMISLPKNIKMSYPILITSHLFLKEKLGFAGTFPQELSRKNSSLFTSSSEKSQIKPRVIGSNNYPFLGILDKYLKINTNGAYLPLPSKEEALFPKGGASEARREALLKLEKQIQKSALLQNKAVFPAKNAYLHYSTFLKTYNNKLKNLLLISQLKNSSLLKTLPVTTEQEVIDKASPSFLSTFKKGVFPAVGMLLRPEGEKGGAGLGWVPRPPASLPEGRRKPLRAASSFGQLKEEAPSFLRTTTPKIEKLLRTYFSIKNKGTFPLKSEGGLNDPSFKRKVYFYDKVKQQLSGRAAYAAPRWFSSREYQQRKSFIPANFN